MTDLLPWKQRITYKSSKPLKPESLLFGSRGPLHLAYLCHKGENSSFRFDYKAVKFSGISIGALMIYLAI